MANEMVPVPPMEPCEAPGCKPPGKLKLDAKRATPRTWLTLECGRCGLWLCDFHRARHRGCEQRSWKVDPSGAVKTREATA